MLPLRSCVAACAESAMRSTGIDTVAVAACMLASNATRGRVYYEVTVRDDGLCRVGWSTAGTALHNMEAVPGTLRQEL